MDDAAKEDLYERLEQGDITSLPYFRTHAAELPWLICYRMAITIYHHKPDQEAIMWFYAGQFRARIASRFDSDPTGTAALTGSLNEVIGRPINEFAGSDKDLWLRATDAAIAWTKAHPYTMAQLQNDLSDQTLTITEAELQTAIADGMKGITGLRDKIAQLDPAELKRQRQESGIE